MKRTVHFKEYVNINNDNDDEVELVETDLSDRI